MLCSLMRGSTRTLRCWPWATLSSKHRAWQAYRSSSATASVSSAVLAGADILQTAYALA